MQVSMSDIRKDIHRSYREEQRRMLDLPQPDESEYSTLDANYEKNRKYVKIPRRSSWQTPLSPTEEQRFRKWVTDNRVPFNFDTPRQDYDMRGFWKGLQSGDPAATQSINQNDGMMHYSDKWKTPYHKSFSNESRWAGPNAPGWNKRDQLVTPDGRVVYDERSKK